MGRMWVMDALVAELISESLLALNKGKADGVETGSRARVLRTVEIKDPETGDLLGSVRTPVLNLHVTSIYERFCLASVSDYTKENESNSTGVMTSISSLGKPRRRKEMTLKGSSIVPEQYQSDDVVTVSIGQEAEIIRDETEAERAERFRAEE